MNNNINLTVALDNNTITIIPLGNCLPWKGDTIIHNMTKEVHIYIYNLYMTKEIYIYIYIYNLKIRNGPDIIRKAGYPVKLDI